MSLRRSARVQALDPVAAIPLPDGVKQSNGVKRKAATAVPKTTKKAIKPSPSVEPNSNATPEPEDTAYKTPIKTSTKRRKLSNSTPKAVPFTPTPAAIGLMTAKTPLPSTHSTQDIDDSIPSHISPSERPADPHTTNAPLSSPTDNKTITAYSPPEPNTTSDPPPPSTTTNTLLDQALAHLSTIDKTHFSCRLAPVLTAHHCAIFSATGLSEPLHPFRSLASGIMAQQVSGAAASSIKKKFISLFSASPTHSYAGPPHFPPPGVVVSKSVPELRTAGLSQRKAEYILGLAAQFVSGELNVELLATGSDEEVMERLVQVRGLGRWSVEMFCCFGLKRTDVFSTGDLGVQRGIAAYLGRDVARLKKTGKGKWKYLGEKEMLETAELFRPYRSLFMWYMWRIEETDVQAVQGG